MHDSKEKGDIGVSQVIADLYKNGYTVALPLSEHLPFDLIGISQEGFLRKISVKYRKTNKIGIVEVPLRTISSNSKGYKVKTTNLEIVDAFAIYNPDTNKCYYINSSELKQFKNTFTLRVNTNIKGNYNRINWAENYTDIKKIFNSAMGESGLILQS